MNIPRKTFLFVKLFPLMLYICSSLIYNKQVSWKCEDKRTLSKAFKNLSSDISVLSQSPIL